MNKNLHNIDDLFKKGIDEHEDTPSLKVWEDIDKNLDKKKVVSISKKYNKLKWAAAILLVCSFGMAMYVWQTRIKNKELVKQNNINKASKNNKEFINNEEKKSTPSEITTPQTEKNKQQQNDKLNPSDTQTATTTIEKEQADQSQQKIIKEEKESTKENVVFDQDRSKPPGIKKDNKQKHVNNNETVLENNEKAKEVNNKMAESNNNISAEKYFIDAPLVFKTHPSFNDLLLIQRPTDPFLSSLHFLSAPAENITADNNKNSYAKNKKIRAAKSSLFSATIFFSPEFISSHVKDDHPRFREDNRNEIKNNEKVRSSVTYGILIGYAVGNKLKLESGASVFIRVTDINTKMAYARPDEKGNVNFRLSCSAGNAFVTLKSGIAPVQGDSTRILSAKNTLQYVSIPLAVRYSIGKGKFNLVPGVGMSANILSKAKVETVIAAPGGNENSSTSNIEGLKSHFFSGKLSLGANYNLSKKIELNFTPATNFALSSINKDAAVKTKLNSFGLSAGITIKF